MFKCGEDNIEVVEKYKYLGLRFTDMLALNCMAKQVAASAHRALGLLSAKYKALSCFPHECYHNMYNSLVQSIIDYGACILGHR